MSLNNQSKISDSAAAMIVIIFVLMVGFTAGYVTRAFTSNDRMLRASAARFFSMSAYYDAEFDKLKAEGSKPAKSKD